MARRGASLARAAHLSGDGNGRMQGIFMSCLSQSWVQRRDSCWIRYNCSHNPNNTLMSRGQHAEGSATSPAAVAGDGVIPCDDNY